jgi:hypothetical protein
MSTLYFNIIDICDECENEYNIMDVWFTNLNICLHCYKDKLIITYCKKSQIKLCRNLYCKVCFNRSYASDENSKYWDYENNTITPRDITSADHRLKVHGICRECYSNTGCYELRTLKKNKWCFDCHQTIRNHDHYVSICKKKNKDPPVEQEDNKYKNSNSRLLFKCKVISHKPYIQNVRKHFRTIIVCKECLKIIKKQKYSKSHDQYISECINLKLDLPIDREDNRYINTFTKLYYKCKVSFHKPYYQYPGSHLSGKGCKKCADERNGRRCAFTHEEYIKKCIDMDVDLPIDKEDNRYVNSHIKLLYKCRIHGEIYSQKPRRHIEPQNGCRKCDWCPSCEHWKTFGRLCCYCVPSSENKLYNKTKEMDVVRFLRDNLPDNDFIHNKSVGSECTGKHLFPDILFECVFYNLIVEVDEFKHRGNGYSCDESRMYDIIAKVGVPCIFIRYNPDGKHSNKNVLLEKIKYYLTLEGNFPWNDISGLFAEYLFY